MHIAEVRVDTPRTHSRCVDLPPASGPEDAVARIRRGIFRYNTEVLGRAERAGASSLRASTTCRTKNRRSCSGIIRVTGCSQMRRASVSSNPTSMNCRPWT